MTKLPHLSRNGDLSEFQIAVPEPSRLDEADYTAEDELADPMPQLARDTPVHRRRGQATATTQINAAHMFNNSSFRLLEEGINTIVLLSFLWPARIYRLSQS